MNIKLTVVFLLALVAASLAAEGFTIFNTYADKDCAKYVGTYATNDSPYCVTATKRSTAAESKCHEDIDSGLFYTYDTTYCNGSLPSFPASWQVIQLTTDTTCNATANSTVQFIAAPTSLNNAIVAVVSYSGVLGANTTLGCDATTGKQTLQVCVPSEGQNICFGFNLSENECTADNTSGFSATQSTCIAPPVAVPVATPSTSSTPVKAPSTKASSASLLAYGSVAFVLSLVALM